MNNEFIKDIYNSIIEENGVIYLDLLENTKVDEINDEYWKRLINLYNHVDGNEKKTILDLIRHISIDTLSNVFGIIDGSSSLEHSYEIRFVENGNELSGYLQDFFLEYVEQKNS